MSKLELRIHKVKCVDETDGLLGSESGDDEIYLGGTTVDESEDPEQVAPFQVRDDFDDGEEQIYLPPKQFASFDLTEGTEFPKSYFVTLVLAEVDNVGFPELLHKLLMWVKEKVTAALTTAIGTLIGSSGGPIGAAVGAAVGLIIDFIKDIWEDDAFLPATARVNIPSYTARWPGDMSDSPEEIITYKGHGEEYQVTFDWRMYGPQPERLDPAIPRATTGIIYAIKRPGLDSVTGRPLGRPVAVAPCPCG